MGHPYKEPGQVLPDLAPVLFGPKQALEMVAVFKPERDVAIKKKKSKLQAELWARENEEKIEADKNAFLRWPEIEKEIKQAAKNGKTVLTTYVEYTHNTHYDYDDNPKLSRNVLIAYVRNLGWDARKSDNLEIAIYWGRGSFIWPRMRLYIAAIISILLVIFLYYAH